MRTRSRVLLSFAPRPLTALRPSRPAPDSSFSSLDSLRMFRCNAVGTADQTSSFLLPL